MEYVPHPSKDQVSILIIEMFAYPLETMYNESNISLWKIGCYDREYCEISKTVW